MASVFSSGFLRPSFARVIQFRLFELVNLDFPNFLPSSLPFSTRGYPIFFLLPLPTLRDLQPPNANSLKIITKSPDGNVLLPREFSFFSFSKEIIEIYVIYNFVFLETELPCVIDLFSILSIDSLTYSL